MDMFSNKPRKIYEINPIKEVICQFRFPAILLISSDNTEKLALFQDRIRDEFPDYELNFEHLQQINFPTLLDAKSSDAKLTSSSTKNHCFKSLDGKSKINLTNNFIAYSSVEYSSWDKFLGKFLPAIKSFILEFQPLYFNRLGLRYIDAIRRSDLKLTNSSWRELINPIFLGSMGASDVSEEYFSSNSIDSLIRIDQEKDLYYLKLHAGLAKFENDPELQYVIDSDFYTTERLNIDNFENPLNYLHGFSGRLIRSCFSSTLEAALGEKNE